MCGIAGAAGHIVTNYSSVTLASALLSHRGPDDEGIALLQADGGIKQYSGTDSSVQTLDRISSHHFRDPLRCVLLHRRLSIIDLTSAGHQPMVSDDGRYLIVINGEIYNYLELREELESKGCVFKGESDTEVALMAYQRYGLAAFSRFIGMWALCVYDRERNTVTLCRDRFGIKPLYYGKIRGVLYFASEIKAIWALSESAPEVKTDACKSFILYGEFGEEEDTIYEGIWQVAPGSYCVYSISSGDLTVTRYYNLHRNIQKIRERAERYSAIDALAALQQSMRLHLRSDVPIGACLSGGLDSTTLTSLARGLIPADREIRTFSAVYPGEGINEQANIDTFLSSMSNVRGSFVTPTAKALVNAYPRLIWHQELPFNSTSIFSQWEVMRLAANNGMKVLIDGQGADEVCAGYYPFGGVFLLEQLRSFRFMTALREYWKLRKNMSKNIGHYVIAAILESTKTRNIFGGRIGKTTSRFLNSHGEAIESKAMPERWGRDMVDHSLRTIKYGLQQLLRYEDRNSMAFSIESRVPFLDHRFVEIAIGLPSKDKISNGYLKAFMRKAMGPHLHGDIVWQRGKIGFATPQQSWRKQLSSDHLNQVYEGLRALGIVNIDEFNKRWSATSMTAAEESETWRIYTLGMWADIMLKEWMHPPVMAEAVLE